MNASTTRIAFAAATAVTAAAFVDPVVENLSNTGAFGPGRFTAGRNADVLPTRTIGALLCIAFVALSVRRSWATRSAPHSAEPCGSEPSSL